MVKKLDIIEYNKQYTYPTPYTIHNIYIIPYIVVYNRSLYRICIFYVCFHSVYNVYISLFLFPRVRACSIVNRGIRICIVSVGEVDGRYI